MTVTRLVRLRRLSATAVAALVAVGTPQAAQGQGFAVLTLGYNLTDETFIRNEVTDPFGNPVGTYYQADNERWLLAGAGLQLGKGPVAVRVMGAYSRAGDFDALKGGTSSCTPGDPGCLTSLVFPVRIITGELDLMIRPWRPRPGRYVTPYLSLGPTGTYRLPTDKLKQARSLEPDGGSLLLSGAVGLGIQFNLWNPARDALPLGGYLEGRYANLSGSLLPTSPIKAGSSSVRLGQPFAGSQFSFRFGFLINLAPNAAVDD